METKFKKISEYESLITIEEIEKNYKKIMEKSPKLKFSLIITQHDDEKSNYTKSHILGWDDYDSKEKLKDDWRKKINDEGIKRYFTVFESFISSNIFIDMPSNDPKRKDCLVISEFNNITMENKIIILEFKRENNKIIWGKRITNNNDISIKSDWNFYIESHTDEEHENERTKSRLIASAEYALEQMKKDEAYEKIKDEYKKHFGKDLTEEEAKETLIELFKKKNIMPIPPDDWLEKKYKNFKKQTN